MSILDKEEEKTIDDFLAFMHASPSPFHAVETMVTALKAEGFKQLDEREDWKKLSPGGYYITRNQSTIVAFVVPPKWKPGNGFTMQAAHTDSPVFKVKPRSKSSSVGYLQVGVEHYGGGLWHTWFDRDLSVAGRVLVKKERGKFESRLVRIDRPLLRVSTLAIHLNREVRNGFKFNDETHTVPMFATEAACALSGKACEDTQSPLEGDHHPLLLRLLAEELKISPDDILDFELCLFDTQAPCRGGGLNEFVFSARLDNQCSCFVILRALLNAQKTIKNETNIRLIAAFDNEEVGSTSNRGADSNLLLSIMQRLTGNSALEAALQKSILLSVDMAHAVHPNYQDKHEGRHRPAMHGGLVLKYNANQRYASTMVSAFHLQELARRLQLPLQKFAVRNDSPCGSTIGPKLSANCGLRTVDVGMPQLSMHSIREVCGVRDIVTTERLFTAFFSEFVALDDALVVDKA